MDGETKMNNISSNLRNLRTKRKYKQSEIASIIKITQPEYSRYESGVREPKADALIRLADFYNISLDDLIK